MTSADKPVRPGCRNAALTKQAILDAALERFLQEGYDNAGLRRIAGDAGIDPALISRYFGSKRQLFAAVLHSVTKDPMALFRGDDPANCGQRVAETLLQPAEDSERHFYFISLVTNASNSPEASLMAHQHIEQQFIQPFTQWLAHYNPKGNTQEKAWLICSLLMGAAIMRNIQCACELTCEQLGQSIQDILDR